MKAAVSGSRLAVSGNDAAAPLACPIEKSGPCAKAHLGLTANRQPPTAPALVRGLGSAARGLALTFLGSAVCAAEKPFAAPQAADPVPATGAGSLAQVTLSLVLVLAAVFAAAWVVRRLRGFGQPGSGSIEIVAHVALGARERAVLVQVGKQQLLLGVTANQVNTLHVLTENVAASSGPRMADGVQSAPGAPASAVDFKSILKRSLGL